MKIGFSSACCPTWDLRTILEQAVLMGYDGVELRGLQGELYLPRHPELAQNTAAVVEACTSLNVELVSLGCSASFGSRKESEVEDNKAMVRDYVLLADRLHCPAVRLFTGDIPRGSNRYETLDRIQAALSELAAFAGRSKVTLLLENSGDLAGSRDLWFLLDAVSHPALRACWNPIHSLSVRERPTVAIPRLGVRLGMVHVADAVFEKGVLTGYVPLGQGNTELDRAIELLHGVAYDGYLVVEWPKLWDPALAEPEDFLPAAAAFLKQALSVERKPLSAYKGDKNAPKFGQLPRRMPAR